jgi:hypothetical protein
MGLAFSLNARDSLPRNNGLGADGSNYGSINARETIMATIMAGNA